MNTARLDSGDMHASSSLPIFAVEKVGLQFGVASDFAAAQAANNVLVLALQNGRILRIDLSSPEEVDDVDLPKKPQEIGVIRKMFLDPTASHLIINTTINENFYLHAQSRTPKQLSRLKGVPILTVSWNPSLPTASTREILIGASDGKVLEAYLDSSSELLRREERYAKLLIRTEGPVTGIWTDSFPAKQDFRRIVVTTPSRLMHFFGKLGRHGSEGSGSIYQKLFENEIPTVHELDQGASSRSSGLAVTPDLPDMDDSDSGSRPERIIAWLHSQGVWYGKLLLSPISIEVGREFLEQGRDLNNATLLGSSRNANNSASFIALTQWHILQLFGQRLVASNRLDDAKVYDAVVLEENERPLSLMADLKMNTFWLFTSKQILEIRAEDEDRDIWKILMHAERFEEALQYANNSIQKDQIATASGDYLMKNGRYLEAAGVYGKSSKPFEEVALQFIENGHKDALRKYLLTRLSSFRESAEMQRTMLASWLIEVFMAKMNSLDDTAMTNAELSEDSNPADVERELTEVREEFHNFVRKYHKDIDSRTAFSVLSSHGRERELLFFATAIGDYNYVLSYWSQRENWTEALKALNRQTDANMVYKYSSVLMANAPAHSVDVLMRQDNLDARKLIPALLNYNNLNTELPIGQNQAIRYLLFEIKHRSSREVAVHNTLVSIYASHPGPDESALLNYLEDEAMLASTRTDPMAALPFDVDFTLRLCAQNQRIRSCVLIYTALGQFMSAVELALQHGQTEVAITVAERPEHDASTQKKLWLAIARSVISDSAPASSEAKSARATAVEQSKGLAHRQASASASANEPARISQALSLLKRAPPGVLRIEDLLPLFPDFVLIDAFKEEICSALESYSSQIDDLKREMDDSTRTAGRIRREIGELGKRWVLLEPGECCAVCGQVMIDRRFWVWACGHGVHGDCAAKEIVKHGGRSESRLVRDIRGALESGVQGKRREGLVKELDEVVGKECLVCGELAVRKLDEPLIGPGDDKGAWAL